MTSIRVTGIVQDFYQDRGKTYLTIIDASGNYHRVIILRRYFPGFQERVAVEYDLSTNMAHYAEELWENETFKASVYTPPGGHPHYKTDFL